MIYFYVLLFAADMEDMLLVHIELLPERHHIVSLDKSRYFSSSTNPLGYPRVWREYKKMTPNTFEWLYLTVTERHNMNRCVSRIWSWMKIFREERPCEEDPGRSYDFMVCVKNSQAELNSHHKRIIIYCVNHKGTNLRKLHNYVIYTNLSNIGPLHRPPHSFSYNDNKTCLESKWWQAQEVGCRPGWEEWSDNSWPLCSQVSNCKMYLSPIVKCIWLQFSNIFV